MPDLYEVLQVHPRAEPDVLRAAYRVLARKYHPDHGGDARQMINLNDAWDVLGDPVRRAAYDATRAAQPGRPGAAAGATTTVGPTDNGRGSCGPAARSTVGHRAGLRPICGLVPG